MELIDKQVTIDWLKKVTVTEGISFKAGFKQIIYDIEQMPCVEVRPEKEMTIGVAIAHLEDLQRMYLGNEKFKADVKALDMALKALEQQPCDDCISRDAVDDYITKLMSGYLYDEERTRLEDLTTYIWELPSVQPTRPTGHWIAGVDRWGDIVTTVNGYRCSECCAFNADKDNYCPNCGTKMEGNA